MSEPIKTFKWTFRHECEIWGVTNEMTLEAGLFPQTTSFWTQMLVQLLKANF